MEFGYYTKEDIVKTGGDGNLLSAVSTFANAGISGIVNYVTTNLDFSQGTKVLKILASPLGSNSLAEVIAIPLHYTAEDLGNDTFRLVINGVTTVVSTALVYTAFATKAVTVATAITGAPIVGLSAIGAAVVGVAATYTVSFLKNISVEIMDYLIDGIINPSLADELKFYDQSGEHISGVFYTEGMDGTSQEHENAVRNFIVQAQGEIIDGGTIEIETSLIDFQLDKSYTLHNASDYFATMLERSSAADELSFLTAGDGKNLNNHVYKGASDHYFFFEDNDVSIDIPVIINGIETIITVNDVYFNGAKVMGAETIIDTQPDVIFGDYGHTSLTGSGEEDLILGYGTNYIDAGSDDDTILGGDGLNTLDGGSGNDNIEGGIYSDSILGGSGNDTIRGHDGNNTIYGGDDDDILHGGDLYDFIVGDGGDDLISGGAGDDTLHGGEEYDLIAFSESNTISGGAGNDVIFGSIVGNDRIFGGDDNDFINGKSGNDTIFGEAGNDTLIGGEGDNTLNGGASSRSVNEVERVRHSITSSAANDNATFSLNLLAA